MKWNLALLFVGIAVGAGGAGLVLHKPGGPRDPDHQLLHAQGAEGGPGNVPDEVTPAESAGEIPASGSRSSRFMSEEERRETYEKARAAAEEMAERQFKEKLLSAGFTPERISFLERRGEELASRRKQQEFERRRDGHPPDRLANRYMLDEDLDLRDEIGEEEYFRYREATDRATSVPVTGVIAGGIAETIGLKPGDEIVSYDGRHVYNYYDLEARASDTTGVGNGILQVRRDGQVFELSVPRGPIGIEQQSWMDIILRESSRKRGELPGR